jgi:predicted N-acetyltransferase YhbS
VTGPAHGYDVREATPSDHDAIVALCADVFGPGEGAAVRHLLDGEGYGPGRWTVAAAADGEVVSCCTLLPHTLRYGRVPVPAAQIEFVATAASARRGGLVRAQFDLHHRWADDLGALVVLITGIPYVYRRLGYGYALDYSPVHRLVDLPVAPDGWEVEDAAAGDVADLERLERAAKARHDLALEWPDGGWDWVLDGASSWDEDVVVARRDGAVHGFAFVQRRRQDGHAEIGGSADSVGAARALLAAAVARCDDLRVHLAARRGDPWGAVVEAAGHHDPAHFNAVYARVPDPVAFVDHVRPELSARLAASPLARDGGELSISTYQDGLVLAYADGQVTGVRRDPEPALDPLDDDRAGVAPDTLPALLLGRFGAVAHERRHDDTGFVADRALMAALFPAMTADVWAPL